MYWKKIKKRKKPLPGNVLNTEKSLQGNVLNTEKSQQDNVLNTEKSQQEVFTREKLLPLLPSVSFFVLLVNFCLWVFLCVIPFCKKKQTKEFKTALITSFILLLIGVNVVMLMNITITIDKTHNIYDLIYAASTYMIL